MEALAKDLPIFYEHVVTGVDYSEGGVAVHTTQQQTFRGVLGRTLYCMLDSAHFASWHNGRLSTPSNVVAQVV